MAPLAFARDLSRLDGTSLDGFFVGWPSPPSPETLRRLLERSPHRYVAIDEEAGVCAGYVTALSDGVLFGYLSSLEVRPEYQGRGVGQRLVSLIVEELSGLYGLDLVCDPDVGPFYEKCGLRPVVGMVIRRPERIGRSGSAGD